MSGKSGDISFPNRRLQGFARQLIAASTVNVTLYVNGWGVFDRYHFVFSG
jgi:hypothetical protein